MTPVLFAGRSSILASILGGVLAAACTGAPVDDPGPDPIPSPVIERLDVRALLGTDELDVVGVTVDPMTGQEFLLDSRLGLFALDEHGASQVLSIADMPVPDVPMRSTFTDIAALGDDRFALTALDNGFLLDLGAGTLTQYFCYLPGDLPDRENLEQLTLSVAYDSVTDRLFAQPETMARDTGEVINASVGEFRRDTGEEMSWYVISELFLAGGMAVEDSGLLLLGQGSQLHRFDRANWTLTPVADLDAWGVEHIAGMALAPSGALLVSDAADHELVRLSPSLLAD